MVTKKFPLLEHCILILLAIISILPFILLIISSFTDENMLILHGYTFLPKKLSLSAYLYLYYKIRTIARAYGITIFVTVVGTTVGLLLTMMLAYPLSRKDLPKRNGFTFFVFFSMLFNGGLVPTYILYTKVLNIGNTVWSLIIPGLLLNAFNVIITRTYFSLNVPDSVVESAYIDGANDFFIFWKIVLPISMPIVATMALFIGLAYWNDWYNGLIYIFNPNLFSIQVVLNHIMSDAMFLATSDMSGMNISGIQIPSTSVRMAIAVVGVIPIIAVYPFFQKYYVKGITIGAVKG